jgi:hypothetical protein
LKVAVTDNGELVASIATSNASPVEVRGRVSGLEGVSLTGPSLNVNLTSPQYLVTLNAPVRPDGLFIFPAVYPGNYTASVRGGGLTNSPTVPVVVTSAGAGELDIPVPGQKDVSGRVIVEGGGAMPVFVLPLGPIAIPQGANGFSSAIPTIRPLADGSFHLVLPEGERRLGPFTNLPPGYAVKSATYGSVDLFNNPLRIARTDTSELHITFVSSVSQVTVSGRITGLDNSDPTRAAALVTLTSASYVGPLTQAIPADGTFTFSNVSPGSYSLRVSGPRLPPGMPARIIEVASKDLRDITYVVPGQKEVTGKVVIEGGGPLPRLLLRVSSADNGPQAVDNAVVPINAQSDGTFRITLAEGQRKADIQVPAGFTLQSFTYGESDLRTSPVKVAASDTAALEIKIKPTGPVSWVKVSGRVIGMDEAATGVRVDLASASFPQVLSASVNPDGTFQFPQVSQGTYNARLAGPIRSAAPAPVTIVVASNDVADVAIAVTRQFTVRGRLVVSGGRANDVLSPIAVDVHRPGGQIISRAIAGDTFTLSVEAGDQNVTIGDLPSGYQIVSAVYGSTDLLKDPLHVNDAPTGEIILTLKKLSSSSPDRLVSISGRVTDVTLKIPAPRKLLISGPGPTDLHEVEISSNGRFTLKGVSPGTYTIRVSGVSTSFAAPETIVVSGKNVSNVTISVH